MRRALAFFAVAALALGACSDDEAAAPTTTATSTTTTTTEAPIADFCTAVSGINDGLDRVGALLIDTRTSGEPAALIVELEAFARLLDDTRTLAPPEVGDAVDRLATGYRGLEQLLFEIDFVISDMPPDDPRAEAIRDPQTRDAIIAINEHCGAPS